MAGAGRVVRVRHGRALAASSGVLVVAVAVALLVFRGDGGDTSLELAAADGRTATSAAGAARAATVTTAATTRGGVTRAASSASAASSPSPSGSAVSPSRSSTASPTGSPTAAGRCLPLYGPGTPVPMTITTTPASAVMTWWHNGDPAAVAYWVGVAEERWLAPATPGGSVRQPPVVWTRVVPPAGCRSIVMTVPGLQPGLDYAVWLDLEARTPETTSGVSRRNLNHVFWVRLPAA